VCGLGAALIFVFLLLVRERPGERVLPWTPGEAAPQNEPPPSFFQVFSDLNHILWSRASLVMMLIMFMAGMFSGYGRALMPIAAVQVFHFTTPQWAELNAIMGFAGAAIALILGPVIDRYGAKSVMGLTMLLTGVHAFTLASTQATSVHDFAVDPAAAHHHGLRAGAGDEPLHQRRVGHPVRDLHVGVQPRRHGRIPVLRHRRRVHQLE
jgi:predicted MFS family arabinose efflux permease